MTTRPGEDSVATVWLANCPEELGAVGSLSLLTGPEEKDVFRFAGEADRAAFAYRRIMRRTILAASVGVAPDALTIHSDCKICGHPDHGKPYIDAPVSFSSSRSADLVGVAVAPFEIGLDLEAVARAVDVAKIATVVPLDLAGLVTDEAMLRAWVYMEASMKESGRGFLADPQRMKVVEEPSSQSAVVLGPAKTQWWARPVALDVGFFGAVASRKREFHVRSRRWPGTSSTRAD